MGIRVMVVKPVIVIVTLGLPGTDALHMMVVAFLA